MTFLRLLDRRLGSLLIALAVNIPRAACGQDDGAVANHVINEIRLAAGVDVALSYGTLTGFTCAASVQTRTGIAVVGWGQNASRPTWGGKGVAGITPEQRSSMDAGIHGCDITRQQVMGR